MTKNKPPIFGEPLESMRPSQETLDLLLHRRSTTADCLRDPGPEQAELDLMLAAASRVPDHRRVVPYRFIIFKQDGRTRAGNILAAAFDKNCPDATDERIDLERRRFERAPIVVGVVCSVDRDHRTPEFEQLMTVGAVCQNLLIAASASGFAAQWLTEWYAFDANVTSAFGLVENERMAGFVYLGTAKENPKERRRPDTASLVTYF